MQIITDKQTLAKSVIAFGNEGQPNYDLKHLQNVNANNDNHGKGTVQLSLCNHRKAIIGRNRTTMYFKFIVTSLPQFNMILKPEDFGIITTAPGNCHFLKIDERSHDEIKQARVIPEFASRSAEY